MSFQQAFSLCGKGTLPVEKSVYLCAYRRLQFGYNHITLPVYRVEIPAEKEEKVQTFDKNAVKKLHRPFF